MLRDSINAFLKGIGRCSCSSIHDLQSSMHASEARISLVGTSVRIHACKNTCVRLCMIGNVFVHSSSCMCVCVCMCVCACECAFNPVCV